MYQVLYGGGRQTPFQVKDQNGKVVYCGQAGACLKFNTYQDQVNAFVSAVRRGTSSPRAQWLRGGSIVDVDFPDDCIRKFKQYEHNR